MSDYDCLEFKNICAEIHSKKFNKMILNNINFSIRSGESLAIMGSSGAGKTTLLNIIRGVVSSAILTNGSISLNGEELNKLYDRLIYTVEQTEISTVYYSVYEHLYSVARGVNRALNDSEIKNKIEEILNCLSLTDIRNTKMKDVSGGELKRTNVAQALLSDKKIIILDEPTSGLDSKLAIELVSYVTKMIKRENRILILTIHQPSNAIMHMIDDVLFVKHGRSIYYGKYDNIENFFKERGFVLSTKFYTLIEFLYFLGSDTKIDEETAKNKEVFDVYERGLKSIDFKKEKSNKNKSRVKNVFNIGLFPMLLKKEFVYRIRNCLAIEIFSMFLNSIFIVFFIFLAAMFSGVKGEKGEGYIGDVSEEIRFAVSVYDVVSFFISIWYVSIFITSMNNFKKKIKSIEKGHYTIIELITAASFFANIKIIFNLAISIVPGLLLFDYKFSYGNQLLRLLCWYLFYFAASIIDCCFFLSVANLGFSAYIMLILFYYSSSRIVFALVNGLKDGKVYKIILQWIILVLNCTPLSFVSILYHRFVAYEGKLNFLNFSKKAQITSSTGIDEMIYTLKIGNLVYIIAFLMLIIVSFAGSFLLYIKFATPERIPLEKKK